MRAILGTKRDYYLVRVSILLLIVVLIAGGSGCHYIIGAPILAVGDRHTVGLQDDGTVVATGSNLYGQTDVEDWTDIVQVEGGARYTVGLQEDGTVVATGDNSDGQCDVEDWTDIQQVSAGGRHTVGLQDDGTVVATGCNLYGQTDVEHWTDIVQVEAHSGYTVGVKSDGTVVGTRDAPFEPPEQGDVGGGPVNQQMAAGHGDDVSPMAAGAGEEMFTKLPDPDELPAGVGRGVAFSADSTYMAVAHAVSPFITIYKRDGDTFTRLPDPAELPAGAGNSVAFSHDSSYMAVAHSDSPRVTIYKRNGDTFNKLSDPDELPRGAAYSVAFSPDSTYMAVAHSWSPHITIYRRNGDSFNKLPDPDELPAGIGRSVAFSHDSAYMAVAHSGSPHITIYRRDGDTFNKLPDPDELPGGGQDVAFSPDSTYMAVAHGWSPHVTIYRRDGDTFTKLSDPTEPPAGGGEGVAFSPDSTYVAVAHLSSPYIAIYKRDGDSFTRLPDPAELPALHGQDVAFSHDSAHMAVAHAFSPFVSIYKSTAPPVSDLKVTTTELPDGQVGEAYQATLEASGGTEPYIWGIIDGVLPPGLGLETGAGVISGTPTEAGAFDFTVRATDAAEDTATGELSIAVSEEIPPPVEGWTDIVQVAGGDYHIVGLKSDRTVVAAGSNEYGQLDVDGWTNIFSIAAGYGHTVGVKFDGTMVAVGLNDDGQCDVDGWTNVYGVAAGYAHTVGVEVDGSVVAVGSNEYGQSDVEDWALTRPFCNLSISATDGGSVTEPGEGTFTYVVGTTVELVAEPDEGYQFVSWTGDADEIAEVNEASTTITIYGNPEITASFEAVELVVHTTGLWDGHAGVAYEATLEASGGTEPYTWAIIDGVLPPGLALETGAGVISGTPTEAGTFDFTVQVTDAVEGTATRELSMAISEEILPLAIHTLELPDGEAEVAYEATLEAGGGTGPYTWAIIDGVLPLGLGLERETGVISGTPAIPGNLDFTVRVTDAAEVTVDRELSIAISGEILPLVYTAELPDGELGMAYEATLEATGGFPPYSWEIVDGVLPDGLGLDADTGVISGTPTEAGAFDFTVQVTDATDFIADRELSITVSTETPIYELTIASTDGGEVTVPGVGEFPYEAGTVVDLVAVADEGYRFVEWTGGVDEIDDVHAAETTITMLDDYSITAEFDLVENDFVDNPPIEVGLESIADELLMVYVWRPATQSWDMYWPQAGIETIGTLEVGTAYWILVDSDCTLQYGTRSWELSAGWHNIGWLPQ